MDEKKVSKLMVMVGGFLSAVVAVFYLVFVFMGLFADWGDMGGREIAFNIIQILLNLATLAGLGFFSTFSIMGYFKDGPFDQAPIGIAFTIFGNTAILYFLDICILGGYSWGWAWVYLIFGLIGVILSILTYSMGEDNGKIFQIVLFSLLFLVSILLLCTSGGVGIASNIFVLLASLAFLGNAVYRMVK